MVGEMCVFTADAREKCGTHKGWFEGIQMILPLDENVVLGTQRIVSDSHLQTAKFWGIGTFKASYKFCNILILQKTFTQLKP